MCDQINSSAFLKTVQGSSGLLHFVSRSAKFKAGSVWTFSPIMASTRVCWLLRHEPKLLKLAVEGRLQYGGLDSWLLFKLVGGPWQTDRSNLSAAGFYDPWTDGPSSLVFSLLNVPPTLFTRCDKASASQWGKTRKELFGGAELPVLAVVSDQGAAVAGECCFEAGEAKVTMGSGAFFSMTTGRSLKGARGGPEVQYPYEGVYPLVAFEIGAEATYMVEGSEPACGTGLDWVGKAFGLWDDVATTSDVANSVSDTQGVTFVPSLFGLRAPHNHNKSKGAFIGLTTAASRPHLVRAVLESVAWRLFELLQCINTGPTKVKSIRVGGGVSQNDFICQFLADVTGIPVHRGGNVEVTVTGAAILAGIACGWFHWTPEGKAALRKLTQAQDKVFQPKMNRDEVGKRFMLWTDACDRVKMQ
jgi:glycerol kinase